MMLDCKPSAARTGILGGVPLAKPMMSRCAPQRQAFSASAKPGPPTGSNTTSTPAQALAEPHCLLGLAAGLYVFANRVYGKYLQILT